MTVYYFDPDGGNNANDGLTFATRKKDANLFSPAANDELRFMAARDAYSIGNATWTNGFNNITLAAAKTATVENCDTAWTASANVVCSIQTTSAQTRMWKQGAAVARAVVAAAFTTGIVCYKALGATLNLSAYQCISMRFGNAGTAPVAGSLRLDLCSDAVGAVPVASLTVPLSTATNSGYTVFMDNGAPLPANVNSIAIYATADPGSVTIELDNIIATKPYGDANHISLDSLIGKANPGGDVEFYPVRSIDGTAVVIGPPEAVGATTGRTYPGTTATVDTVVIQPQVIFQTQNLSSQSAKFLVTGGWDRVGMTAQTGETFLAGRLSSSAAFSRTNLTCDITKVSYSGFVNSTVQHVTLAGDVTMKGKYCCGCVNVVADIQLVRRVEIDYMLMNGYFGSATVEYKGDTFIRGKLWAECDNEGSTNFGFWRTTYTCITSGYGLPDVKLDKIRNCSRGYGGSTTRGNKMYLRDCVMENNGTDFGLTAFFEQLFLDNVTFTRAAVVADSVNGGQMVYSRRNGDARLSGFVTQLLACEVQTLVVPATGDTAAWAFRTGTSASTDGDLNYPKYPVARLQVTAGATYNIAFEHRRSNAGVTGKVEVIDTNGVAYGALINGAANTWVTTNFSFTAAADGFVDITLGQTVPNSSYLIYIANIVVT